MAHIIKFRGKSRHYDRWVYGYYYVDKGAHFIHLEEPDELFEALAVSPETVGQFTGMPDMDGKEIYEGDVVEDALSIGIWKIIFIDACFKKQCISDTKPVCQIKGKYKETLMGSIGSFPYNPHKHCKVIGNIHESEGGDAIEKQD